MDAHAGNSLDWHLLIQAREALAQGAATPALQLAQDSLTRAQSYQDGYLIANALRTLAHAQLLCSNLVAAEQLATLASQSFEVHSDPCGLSDALVLRCYAAGFLGAGADALRIGEESTNVGVAAHSPLHQSAALCSYGLAAAWLERDAIGDAMFDAAVWSAQTSSLEHAPFPALATRCFAHAMELLRHWQPGAATPDMSKLAQAVRQAQAHVQSRGLHPWHSGTLDVLLMFYEFGQFTLLLLVGHLPRAAEHLALCERVAKQAKNPPWLGVLWTWAKACYSWANKDQTGAIASAVAMTHRARAHRHAQLEALGLDLVARVGGKLQ